jgi:hypothetical protein
MKKLLRIAALVCLSAVAVLANSFTIVPTIDSTITSLPTAEANSVISAINTVIGVYETTFSDPITVNITFANMGSGLGESSYSLNFVPYTDYINALWVDKTSAHDLAPLANLSQNATNNPVTGTSTMLVKNADLKALGLTQYLSAGQDGTVSVNMGQTTTGGGSYSLTSVLEHEIDEVLGLGSSLDLAASTDSAYYQDISPEDLFRYGANGSRSYTTNSASAYFSLNGTSDLAKFNNPKLSSCYNSQTDVDSCGDYGDWASGTGQTLVQNAVGTPGASPSLGVELTALDAIGYDLAAVPEPSTWLLVSGGMGLLLLRGNRKKKYLLLLSEIH